ncbi:MAG: hypothetical protein M3Q42_10430 [Pseudomonadota bacterium]|nr:hypothetical protein [Pseudomonadota bacterium]
MSHTGPSAFIVVGDTDWWSTAAADRNGLMTVDSTMRKVRRDRTTATWASLHGAGTRAATTGKCLYAELLISAWVTADPAGIMFGLNRAGNEATIAGAAYPGGDALSIGYQGSGNVYVSAGPVQSGNSTLAPGDKIGVMYTREAGVPKARFIKNGRFNILGFSEDLGDASWSKLNGATAAGQKLTFVNTNSYVLQNVAACGAPGAQFFFSAYVTSSNTTTFNVALTDAADGAPTVLQAFAVTAGVRTRITLAATLGVGFSGGLGLQIYGNGAVTAGTVVTIEELQVNSGLVADPYQKQAGAAGGYAGYPVSLPEGSYRLALGSFYLGGEFHLRVDREDLPSLSCQPWGAAARVADAGGYSPAASIYTDLTGTAVVEAYRRIHSTTGAAFGNAFSRSRSRRSATGLIYVEWDYQALDANDTEIGLSLTVQAGYIGGSATSYGYGRFGTKYNNGVAVAIGGAYVAGDSPGLLWNPSTGNLWFCKNGTAVSGDPVAGTGAHYAGVLGDFYPGSSIWQNGRIRICTHAREQRYRPSYAIAWDGADILPEQHYAGKLVGAPRVKREVSFACWSRQRNRTAPIGSLELANDGGFDALATYDLRDEDVIAYRLRDSRLIAREWTGALDSVNRPSLDICRINVDNATGALAERVNAMQFVIGSVSALPLTPRQSTTLTYDFAQTPWVFAVLYDKGLPYSAGTVTYRRSDTANSAGFQRTANPAGMQAAEVARTFYAIAEIALLNGDFAAWTAGAPNNWTVRVSGGSTVVQNGTAARLNAAGAGGAGVSQVVAPVAGRWYGVRVTISQYHAGADNSQPNVYLTDSPANVIAGGAWNGVSVPLHTAAGTGVFYGAFYGDDAAATWAHLLIATFNGDQHSIDEIEFFELGDTAAFGDGLTYLFEILPPKPIDLSFTDCPGNYPLVGETAPRFGMWSKDRPTIGSVIEKWLSSEYADYFEDVDGVVRIAWMLPPEEFTVAPTFIGSIVEREVFGDMSDEADLAPGLSDTLGYSENYAKHNDTDVAAGADPPTRSYLTSDRLTNTLNLSASAAASSAKALHPFYKHGVNGKPVPRLRDSAGTYQTFLQNNDPDTSVPSTRDNTLIRVHRVYAAQRRFYSFSISRTKAETLAIEPGRVIRLTHARFGLNAGKYLQIVSIEQTINQPTVALVVWG